MVIPCVDMVYEIFVIMSAFMKRKYLVPELIEWNNFAHHMCLSLGTSAEELYGLSGRECDLVFSIFTGDISYSYQRIPDEDEANEWWGFETVCLHNCFLKHNPTKLQCIPKHHINFKEAKMITINILQEDDILLSTDWCRPLLLVTMSGGHSDYYSFESCFSGQPENNVKWVRVDQVFGECWIGNPLRELLAHCDEYTPYEFVRGDIPLKHQYGPTLKDKRDEYEQYERLTVFNVGKHKGKTIKQIRDYHNEYYQWAVYSGLILTLEAFSREIDKHWDRLCGGE